MARSAYLDTTTAGRTSDRLLMLIKCRGPQTAAALGTAVGTTGEAVRQQLIRLAEEGLVIAHAEPAGVGRPAQHWELTEKGHARFPDSHSELTVTLIRTIRETLGEDALDRVIAAREAETRTAYAGELAGAADLGERLKRLAKIRTREGYMAEVRREKDGTFLLVENNCSICAAASTCQGFCRAELDIFRDVIGKGATVTRVEHILAGARRCAYRVVPKDAERPSAKRAETKRGH